MHFHHFKKLFRLPTELIRIIYTDLFEDAIICNMCKSYFNSRLVKNLIPYRKKMKCANCIDPMICIFCKQKITNSEKVYRYNYIQTTKGPLKCWECEYFHSGTYH